MASPGPLSDYHIFPITIPRPSTFAPSSLSLNATPLLHYLYICPHAPKVPTPDTPRSLFIANLPIDSTTAHLRSLFASIRLGGARVERVEFDGDHVVPSSSAVTVADQRGKKRKRAAGAAGAGQDQDVAQAETDMAAAIAQIPPAWDRRLRPSGGSGVVVFVDRASLDVAVRGVKKMTRHSTSTSHSASEYIIWGQDVEAAPLGFQRYKSHLQLQLPPLSLLTTLTNTYMAAYAARESAHSTRAHRARAVPDADGFVTVSRGAARTGPARLEGARAKAAELEERRRKKAAEGFYRFQVREGRKRDAELVRGKMSRGREMVEEVRRRRLGVV